jgi:hypothetical protein
MNSLQQSFEDVADWCERHLEAQKGRAIGMTFGGMLRAYGRLATMRDGADRRGKVDQRRLQETKAETMLLILSSRIVAAHSYLKDPDKRMAQPASMRTNMIYDTGGR